MKVLNFLQVNDWPIKKLIIIISTFQLLLWGSISLDLIDFKIPILRQLVCLIYLTFVPGILILRVFRLHKLGSIKSLLYSIGLSLSFLMFIGLFMNIFYPIVGIEKPISLIPLTFTISVIVLALCIFSYILDKDFLDIDNNYIEFNDLFSKTSLLLYCIVFIPILGAYFVNYYMNNKLIFLFLIFIPFLICLVEFNILKDKYYPLLIFIISISLLYHTSLISKYVVEWADGTFEYWISSKVLNDSVWIQYYSAGNAMLSVAMIAPIYSIFCNLSLVSIFKLVYPFFFSFVPVGLYILYNEQISNNKMSLYSVFFFIFMFSFYTAMIGLARQQMAELFFVLLLTLFTNKNIPQILNSVLGIIFVFSIIVSHYAFSYILLGSLVCSQIYLYIDSNISIIEIIKRNVFRIPSTTSIVLKQSRTKNYSISTTFILLTAVFIFFWYIFISNSSAFDPFISILKNISSNFFTDFLSPGNNQGLDILLNPSKREIQLIYKVIHVSTLIFIFVGVIHSLIIKKNNKIQTEYLAISTSFLLLCISGVIIPHFASSINTDRLYGISLLILSPYCIIGSNLILTPFLKLSKSNALTYMSTLRFFSLFLIIYFLFNSGFVYELCGCPSSYSLNQTAVNQTSFDLYDISGVAWLNENIKNDKTIYTDARSAYLTEMIFGEFNPLKKDASISLTSDSYLFLGSKCIKDNILWLDDPVSSRLTINPIIYSGSKYFNEVITNDNIYTNGYTKIYYNPNLTEK